MILGDEYSLNIEGHPLRNPFWRELDEGLITFRDSLQFELKSDFHINPKLKKNVYTQEFYMFIPETLQINKQTYSMKQFYLDQTNMIRYKTPFMTLEELADENNRKSPLVRVQTYQDKDRILRELMLLGNIFRSTLRVRIRRLIKELQEGPKEPSSSQLSLQIQTLCNEIQTVRIKFREACDFYQDRFEVNHFNQQVVYIDEFMSEVIGEYLTLFLDSLRRNDDYNIPEADQAICDLLLKEKKEITSRGEDSDSASNKESILYRQGLLEKFMISVLKLRNTRVRMKEKHADYIAAVAAGIAMLVYMVLFIWGLRNFVMNSAPFVIMAVVFYILKDRIKEGLKTYYFRKASNWFPDFSTEIQSPLGGETIGHLTESFNFITQNDLPKGFKELRYKDDDSHLEAYQPEETIMHYKREVTLSQRKSRLNEINTIFRYNVHRFLEKANDPIQPTLTINPESHELSQQLLPKIYHINIILKNTFQDRKLRTCIEIKKFRVIIDKDGIRRVEHISSHFERQEEKG